MTGRREPVPVKEEREEQEKEKSIFVVFVFAYFCDNIYLTGMANQYCGMFCIPRKTSYTLYYSQKKKKYTTQVLIRLVINFNGFAGARAFHENLIYLTFNCLLLHEYEFANLERLREHHEKITGRLDDKEEEDENKLNLNSVNYLVGFHYLQLFHNYHMILLGQASVDFSHSKSKSKSSCNENNGNNHSNNGCSIGDNGGDKMLFGGITIGDAGDDHELQLVVSRNKRIHGDRACN